MLVFHLSLRPRSLQLIASVCAFAVLVTSLACNSGGGSTGGGNVSFRIPFIKNG
jgi:hypothetical protein